MTKISDALVVVESPAKAKTIEKYLGKGFKVMASKGHVVDLPKSGLGVDETTFDPDYQIIPGKSKVIQELKKLFKDKSNLVIAVDPDREGEAIGWHVANKLGTIGLDGKRSKKQKEKGLYRIVFTEITKNAVQNALTKPRDLDVDLLNAQQSRRILDRLVGYKLSPLLWKKIRYGLSAGRVQSVALKFIVDRERERDAFNSDEFWRLKAVSKLGSGKEKALPDLEIQLSNKDKEKDAEAEILTLKEGELLLELFKIDNKLAKIAEQQVTSDLVKNLEKSPWTIDSVISKETKRYAKPPFTTSTMQQTAANMLGFSAKRTMSTAQKLYEAGHITYMRTDSTNMADEAVADVRKYIEKQLGAVNLPASANLYKTKAKVAQEAHEAIRPSNVKTAPRNLNLESDQARLYELIWQRTVASQMTPAVFSSKQIIVKVETKFAGKSSEAEFKASGQTLLHKGYLTVYPEKFSETELPDIKSGDRLDIKKLIGSQHFTQPPARFSEATLIKELEKYGIGRPSTYSPILTTIQSRGYVERIGKYFAPTDTGIVVIKLLEDNFPEIVDREFTAEMEEDLDRIANGEKDWKKFLGNFYNPLAKNIAAKSENISRQDYTVLGDAPKGMTCPLCKSKMIIKLGKYGRFYSCTKFPDCKGMLNIDGTSQEDIEKMSEEKEFKESYEPAPLTEEGEKFLLKRGRFGYFWAHPKYPKVKDARALVYTRKKLVELHGEPPKTKDNKREFLFKTGKFGSFWAHPDYPKVKETIRIKAKPKTDLE